LSFNSPKPIRGLDALSGGTCGDVNTSLIGLMGFEDNLLTIFGKEYRSPQLLAPLKIWIAFQVMIIDQKSYTSFRGFFSPPFTI